MVSEDLYWIEKNIGDIRYVGNCKHEDKNVHEEKMVLEKPQPPQKPKPAEGEEPPAEEQPPAEDPPADGEQKKGLDIFQHEWTKPSGRKNLTQWFFKAKTNITQVND